MRSAVRKLFRLAVASLLGLALFFVTAAPHYTTWDGILFDFMGLGVFAGVGLEMGGF